MQLSVNNGVHSATPEGYRFDMVEALDVLAAAGFDTVDINFCAAIYKDVPGKVWEPILGGEEKEWKERIVRFGEKAAKLGMPVKLSHLPFYKYADASDPTLDFKKEMLRRSAEAAGMLGVRWTVLHVSPTYEGTMEYARDICRLVNGYGVGVAVENSPKSTIDVLCRSVDTLKNEGYDAAVCYDTGHGQLTGASQRDMLTQIGSRLVMLHVHDNHGVKDEHREPYSGIIDWNEVMGTLADIGYKGDLNYEVNATKLPVQYRESYLKYLVEIGRRLIGIYDAAAAK